MADYQHYFLCRPDVDDNIDTEKLTNLLASMLGKLGRSSDVSGTPRIAFVQARDNLLSTQKLNKADFFETIKIGNNCYIESTVTPAFHNDCVKLTSVKRNNYPAGKITIGNNVQLQGTAIICYEQITIEDNVMLGPMVTIMDCSGHALSDRGGKTEMSNLIPAPVMIKEGAWIGSNSIIMRGVEIGENAIIGAGSVVYDSIPANCIALGNPAKIVTDIDPELIKAAS